MAPIGILTAVVSAIRVCGSPSLRAFIGRAQEGAGAVEVELCSSSSRNVGELFNSGGGIARVFGRPKLLEIMHDPQAVAEDFRFPNLKEQGTVGIYLPSEYFCSERSKKEWKEISKNGQEVKRGQLKNDDASSKSLEPRGQQVEPDNDQPYFDIERQSNSRRTVQTENSVAEKSGHEDLKNTKAAVRSPGFAPSPNISLNVGISPVARKWFILSAALGIVLQSAVLVWAAVARYKFNLIQSDSTAGYAVPATVIGTVMVSFGVGLCAYLVDGSTNERQFQRTPGTTRLFWIQPGNQQLGDQIFDSFAVEGDLYRNYITSWKKTPEEEKEDKERIERRWGKVLKVLTRLEERVKCSQYFGASTWHWFLRKCQRFFFEGTVWIAIFTTLIGFILQFLGLRASHSSVSVFQLGVMLVMSIVRGLLRTERLGEGANLMKGDSRKIREGADENTEDAETYIGHEISWLALRLHCTGEERTWAVACFDSVSSTKDLPFTRAISRLWHYPISESQTEIDATSVSVSSKGKQQIIGFKQHDVGKNDDQNRISSNEQEWLQEQRRDEYPQTTHDAVKVFLYRTRLARLTKEWDDKFVAGREVARRLARAIEETADIVFTNFNLFPEWKKVSEIYWPVQCEIEDCSGPKDVFLSLKRDSTSSNSLGNWKVDICELEAMLGLWLRAIQGKTTEATTRLLWCRYNQLFHESSEEMDITYGFDAWRERKQPTARNAKVESNDLNTETWQLPTRLSIPELCAQEVYSFFFMSIANTFHSVGGEDTVIHAQQFYLKNQNIAMIQAAFAESGLGTEDDAWACVFPVLQAHQKLASIFHFTIDARLSSMATKHMTIQDVQGLRNTKDDTVQQIQERLKGRLKMTLQIYHLKNGSLINAKNSEGNTALHLAIKSEYGSIAHELLKFGADSNLADKDGETPLLTAVSQNSEHHVKILLEQGADPGKPGYDGDAPLHRAARHGYLQLVLILLDRKVDIDLPGEGGATALQKALEHFGGSNFEIRFKKEMDIIPGDGVTALEEAFGGKVFEFLLQKGANPNIPDHNGSTPLKRAVHVGYLSGVQMLLDKGADVECPDVNGETPLHEAVEWKSQLEIFQVLLDSGANPNARTITGDTPLHYGISGRGTEEVFGKLLAAGAKPNVQNNSGETPLEKAVDAGRYDAAKLLLDAGADPTIKDKAGETILDRQKQDHTETGCHNEDKIAFLEEAEKIWFASQAREKSPPDGK